MVMPFDDIHTYRDEFRWQDFQAKNQMAVATRFLIYHPHLSHSMSSNLH